MKTMRLSFTPVLLVLALLFVLQPHSLRAQLRELGTGASGPVTAPHLTAELISESETIEPGSQSHIALSFSLEPGWHVYWMNAGDSGEPPRATWVLPKEVSVGPMLFPAPSRLPLGPLMDYGYEGHAVFPFELTLQALTEGSPLVLKAHVRWLVCREVCLPGKAFLGLHLKVAQKTIKATNPLIESALRAVPVPLSADTNVKVTGDRKLLQVEVATGKTERTAEFYPWDDDSIRNAAEQKVQPSKSGALLTVERVDVSDKLPNQLKGVLKLSDNRAYLIDIPVSSSLPVSSAPSNSETSLLAAILLAFGGGTILNLMPCVFPVLFLKALALLGHSGASNSSQRRHGLAYAAGILSSFWLIVAVLLVLRTFGKRAGWGFQLQSPTFVVCMAALLFFMSLSLAGMFDLGLTLTNTGESLAQKSGYAGSFFTGVLATIVATPCTAPLMGAAIGFALSQSALVTLLIFTALAIGLALPYTLLTFVPSWASKLPRPGRWMETLKQLTAIPLLLTVIWLVWVYGRLNGPGSTESTDHIARLLIGLVVLAVSGWILGRWPANRWSNAVATVLVLAGIALPLSGIQPDRLEWQPYSKSVLAHAQEQGRPVFVDFTAAWCLSCQVNERSVLQDKEIEQELAAHHYLLLRADWTRYDAEITDALAGVGRSGVPTYVVFSDRAGTKSTVLPELLTRSAVLDALRRSAL